MELCNACRLPSEGQGTIRCAGAARRIQRDKFDAVVAGVKPVLDCIDLEVAPQPDGRPPCSDTVIERCKAEWENFKSFNHDTTVTVVTHALAVVRSHYQSIDLQTIGGRFAEGLSKAKT